MIPTKKNEHTGEIEEVSDLVIFNNVNILIEYLPQIQHDEKKVNDCATEPHELTHICDALRYFCVSRVSPSKELNVNHIIKKEFGFSDEKRFKDYGEEIEVI